MNPIQTSSISGTQSNLSGTQASAAAAARTPSGRAPGLSFSRHFTRPGISPFDEITWELRDAIIQDYKGRTIFEQKNVEVPADWSMTATNIVASKYLHGQIGTPERESGRARADYACCRVDSRLGDQGRLLCHAGRCGDFLCRTGHLLLNQKVAFNSPVWFNVGCDRLEPNSDAQNWHWNAHDRRGGVFGDGLLQAAVLGVLHQFGGRLAGLDPDAGEDGRHAVQVGLGRGLESLSIRGSMETLSGGGTACGPLSFMRGFDAFAGVIKSGGKTRRAAKMVILNIDHPDIEDFIECKVKEEKKAWHLVQAGYDGSGPDSEAFSSIFFQNANNSVRVKDEFMQAVENDGDVLDAHGEGPRAGEGVQRARPDAQDRRSDWQCGDPGMQYDTTINRWHTSKNTARINASNPCCEYMFLDDSACNLASFNLLKFLTPGGQFDIAAYRHAIATVTTAMEIIVDSAGIRRSRLRRTRMTTGRWDWDMRIWARC